MLHKLLNIPVLATILLISVAAPVFAEPTVESSCRVTVVASYPLLSQNQGVAFNVRSRNNIYSVIADIKNPLQRIENIACSEYESYDISATIWSDPQQFSM